MRIVRQKARRNGKPNRHFVRHSGEREVEEFPMLQDKVSKFQSLVGVSKGLHSADRWKLRSGAWERLPDPTVLKVNAAKIARKSEINDAIIPWLESAGLDQKQFSLEGPMVGKSFTIKFNGEPGRAGICARKALSRMRSSNGTWRSLVASTHGHGDCKVFVNEDKSKKTIETEMATKKIARITKTLVPKLQIHEVRRDGIIASDWIPFIKIVAEIEGDPQLLWHTESVSRLGINSQAIEEQFWAECRAPWRDGPKKTENGLRGSDLWEKR